MQTLRMLLSLRGRVGRLRYWLTNIAAILLALLAIPLASIADSLPEDSFALIGASAALALFALAQFFLMLWLIVSVTVRRLHDRDWSGWWAVPVLLVTLLPDALEQEAVASPWVRLALMTVAAIIGLWSFVELGVLRGTEGVNRFGPDPLAPEDSVAEAFD